MKLFYVPGFCSLSPHIVAREADLRLELVRVDLPQKRSADGRDYLTINPRGYVPALELDDGTVLCEVAALVQYLADLAPEAGLIPAAGTLARVRAQAWLNFVATELHKQFYWLYHKGPEVVQRAQRETIRRRLTELETHFGAHSYLVEDSFGVADSYLFVVLRWCQNEAIDLREFPGVQAFMARVGERPLVREAMAAEGLPRPRD
jgi:glutathione S-transferase